MWPICPSCIWYADRHGSGLEQEPLAPFIGRKPSASEVSSPVNVLKYTREHVIFSYWIMQAIKERITQVRTSERARCIIANRSAAHMALASLSTTTLHDFQGSHSAQFILQPSEFRVKRKAGGETVCQGTAACSWKIHLTGL